MVNHIDPVRALAELVDAAALMLCEIDTCGHPVDPAYRATLHDAWTNGQAALASAPTSAPVGVDAKARRLYEMIFDAIAEDGSQQAEDACIREIASALAQQPAAPSGEAVSDW